jgi:hypothetical protein
LKDHDVGESLESPLVFIIRVIGFQLEYLLKAFEGLVRAGFLNIWLVFTISFIESVLNLNLSLINLFFILRPFLATVIVIVLEIAI